MSHYATPSRMGRYAGSDVPAYYEQRERRPIPSNNKSYYYPQSEPGIPSAFVSAHRPWRLEDTQSEIYQSHLAQSPDHSSSRTRELRGKLDAIRQRRQLRRSEEQSQHSGGYHTIRSQRSMGSEAGPSVRSPQPYGEAHPNYYASPHRNMPLSPQSATTSRSYQQSTSAANASSPRTHDERHYSTVTDFSVPTPGSSSSRVRDLKARLWTPEESLRARQREPEELPATPKTQEMPPAAQTEQTHHRVQPTLDHRFKSRFYQAAAVASNPPSSPSVRSLMSRLQSVDRNDPQKALKEIDAILQRHNDEEKGEERATATTMEATEDDENDDNDDDDETSVSSITNPTFPIVADNSMAPTTRLPRPSHLQKYSGGKKKISSPPPITIQIGSGKKKTSRNTSPLYEATIQEEEEPYEAVKEEMNEILTKDVVPQVASPELISHTATEDLGSIVTPQQPGVLYQGNEEEEGEEEEEDARLQPQTEEAKLRMSQQKQRPHPWDEALHVVDTRETSMEGASGVEMEHVSKNDEKWNSSPLRRLRQERLRRQAQRTFSSDDDEDEGDKKRASAQIDDEQAAMVENFDSAWVALPSSKYFPDPHNSVESSSSLAPLPEMEYRANKNIERDDLEVAHDEKELLDVDPSTRRAATVQTFTAQADDRKGTERQFRVNTAHRSEPRRSAYDERALDHAESEEAEAVEVTLNHPHESKAKGGFGLKNLFRRKVKDRKEAVETVQVTNSKNDEPLIRSATLDEEMPPPRGRKPDNTPNRTRARSLEERRIRNPSIAKKFSRMIRVYDDQPSRAHI